MTEGAAELEHAEQMTGNRKAFLEGMRDGIPIMTGYFAVSFALGIAMRNAGLSAAEGLMMSILNTASAGEYAGITMIASQASLLETALMTLIANARYFLMSCSLSQKVSPDALMKHRFLISFNITDELFGISMAQKGSLNPSYWYGASAVAIPGWAAGTVLGVIAGSALPSLIVGALSVALYGMFLAIIIPPCRKDRVLAGLVFLSFAASYVCSAAPYVSQLSEGTRTIILTVLISAVAAWKYPVKEDMTE